MAQSRKSSRGSGHAREVHKPNGHPNANGLEREDVLRRHLETLTRLSQSRTLANGDHIAAKREITEAAAHTLDVERVGIWLFSQDQSRLLCVDLYERSRHMHCDGMEINATEYPAYFRAVSESRTVAADHAQSDAPTCELVDDYLEPLHITSMLDAPIRIGGELIGVMCHEHIGDPRHWTLDEQTFAGSMADFVAMALQTGRRLEAEQGLERERAFLRQIIDINPNLIFAKDRDGRFTLVNEAVAKLYGTTVEGLIGKTDADFNPNASEVAFFRRIDREVMDSKAERVIPEERVTDARGRLHWLQTVKRPIISPDGTARQVLGVSVDITERKLAQERQTLLIRELDHRVKNNLFAVQSLADRTAASSLALSEFLEAFTGRVASMAVAHEALAETNWAGVQLGELLQRLLQPFAMDDSNRMVLRGQPLLVPARIAPPLCMIIHELATNAAKHGALSEDGGHLHVEWSADREALRIDWHETVSSKVTPPRRRGFGMELIEQLTQHQLHGEATLRFEPGGLSCRLSIPLTVTLYDECNAAVGQRDEASWT